jgi:acyl dehydratase
MTTQLATIPATHKIPKVGEPRSAGWDDFQVGPFPQPFELTVTPEDVARWCRLYDDDPALYTDRAPHYVLYYAGQSIVAPLRDISAGFARFRADFVAPVPREQPLVISGEVLSKYRRRGRGYIEWQVEARADGELVHRNARTWYFGATEEQLAGLEERTRELPPPAPDTAERFGPIALELAQERMNEFEGAGEHNGHTDVEGALERGNPGPVAQGAFAMGLIARMLGDRFGDGFVSGGELDIHFTRTVWANERVEVHGAILDQSNSRAHCRVWAENGNGEEVVVGTASAGI